MFRIALKEQMRRESNRRRKKGLPSLNLQIIHDATGIHRKILSRIVNHPEQPTSSDHIEKLILFFFKERKKEGMTWEQEQACMNETILKLIEVYPEDEDYWKGIERYRSTCSLPGNILWQGFTPGRSSGRVLDLTVDESEQDLDDDS